MGFQQGLSGLNVASKALDAIGNNVSNSGTIGFKSARGEFADVFAASLSGGGAAQIGIGATMTNVAQQFTQGNITSTNNPLDIAINGGGFFQLSNAGAVSYSRNGQFQIDKNGFVVNGTGYRLQGYQADFSNDAAGIIVQSTPKDLFIDPTDLQPKETTSVVVGMNLDSRQAAPNAAGTLPFDQSNPLSYNSSTSVTIYDSLGNPHVKTLYFVQAPGAVPPVGVGTNADPSGGNAAAAWDVYASIDGAPWNTLRTDGSGGNDFGNGPGVPWTLYYDASGKALITPSGTPTFTADFLASAQAIGNSATPPIVIDAIKANPSAAVEVDFNGSTQFGSPFGINNMTQDGFSSGRLAGISISADGVVQGRFSNGQTKKMGQLVLAKFNNVNGLQSLGGNQWQETAASGAALVGAPGTGANGVVQSAAVEESNTDLTAELVNMITQQRAYQASAQTIKTLDSIMQTLVNLR